MDGAFDDLSALLVWHTPRRMLFQAPQQMSTDAGPEQPAPVELMTGLQAPLPPPQPPLLPPPASPPPADNRGPIQLPAHVYLISFVLLLSIMVLLLSCHCWRLCRIANRMEAAGAAANVSITAADYFSRKRSTPDDVIGALPVLRYDAARADAARKALAAGGASTGAQPANGGCSSSSGARQVGSTSAPEAPLQSAVDGTVEAPGCADPGTAPVKALAPVRSAVDPQDACNTVSVPDSPKGAGANAQVSGLTLPSAAGVAAAASSCDPAAEPVAVQSESAGAVPTSVGDDVGEAAGHDRARDGEQAVEQNEEEPCSVCMEEFEDHDDVKVLPCGHIFHVECIDSWLTIDHVCPICRACVWPEGSQDSPNGRRDRGPDVAFTVMWLADARASRAARQPWRGRPAAAAGVRIWGSPSQQARQQQPEGGYARAAHDAAVDAAIVSLGIDAISRRIHNHFGSDVELAQPRRPLRLHNAERVAGASSSRSAGAPPQP